MTYDESLAEVDKLVDGLGMHVDKAIRSVVTALRMHDLQTTSSCEGHLDRGLPYPWVGLGSEPQLPKSREPNAGMDKISSDISAVVAQNPGIEVYATIVPADSDDRFTIISTPAETKWRELKGITDLGTVKQKNFEQLTKLIGLLSEFYASTPNYEKMLILDSFGTAGNVRLQCHGSVLNELRTGPEKSEKLAVYRAEMDRFAAFLRGHKD
jgi:hypothetical protein